MTMRYRLGRLAGTPAGMCRGLSMVLVLVGVLHSAAAQTSLGPRLMSHVQSYCPGEKLTVEPRKTGTRPLEPRVRDLTEAINTRIVENAQNQMADGDVDQTMGSLCHVLGWRTQHFGMRYPGSLAVISNIGVLLRKSGRVQEARIIQEEVLLLAHELNAPPDIRQRFVQNLGVTVFAQGDYAKAEALYRSAIALAAQAGEGKLSSTVLTNLGFALDRQQRYREAEPVYRQALSMRNDDTPDNELDLAAALNNLGNNLTAQGKYEEATPLIRRGLAIRRKYLGDEHLNTAFSLANLARNLRAQGAYAEAETLARQAFQIQSRGLGNTHPDAVAALELLAAIQLERGNKSAALASARSAFDSSQRLSEREVAGLSGDAREQVMRLLGSSATTLVRAGWANTQPAMHAWRAGQADPMVQEAFRATQQIGASGTTDALAQAVAHSAANANGAGATAAELERQLARRAGLERDFTEAILHGDDGALARLKANQARSDVQIARTRNELQTRFPKFFAYLNPAPQDLSSLQGANSHLHDDEVMVILSPGTGQEHGHVWALTRNEGAWAQLPLSGSELDKAITALRGVVIAGVVRAPDTGSTTAIAHGAYGYNADAAYALYRALFGAPDIEGITRKKRKWIIVAQGESLALPYAALVTRPLNGEQSTADPAVLRNIGWLGMERIVSLLPSPASLRQLRELPNVDNLERRPFFGVGDPTFTGAAGALPAAITSVRGLAKLPGTRKEIETMARTLGARTEDVLLAERATETELRRYQARNWLSRYKILTFATHGLVSGDLGGYVREPALALSLPARAQPGDDGLLTASEVALLNLNADWVILSACNSAAGRSNNGEALSGLGRAFMQAGARALLVSHWRVRDDAAEKLTVRTMELMREDARRTRGEALQGAMREVMRDTSSDAISSFALPGAWAAFTLVGVD